MKIGIVCYPTFGGSGVVATELGIALASKGHEIHFITYKQPVRLDFLSPNLHYHEVVLEEYPLFRYQPYELALSSKMVEITEKFKLEILHVHYAIPHAYAAYMAKKILKDKGIKIKIVTTLHGTDITLVGSHPTYKRAVEFSINKSDEVTAVSNSLKEDTERLFSVKKDIKVIYNFIDSSKYNIEELSNKRSFLADSEQHIITHISNFRPVKRTKDVIKVFYEIQKQIPAKLLMIGDGPDRIKTEKLVSELNIQDKVLFMGHSNEVEKILHYSDIFLLPSKTESFGFAALEAMAAKTPVISTNTGGLPEVNINGKTGFLSNLGDIKDMTNNSLKILKNKKTLEEFKNRAQKNTLRFSLKNILSEYEKVYESCF